MAKGLARQVAGVMLMVGVAAAGTHEVHARGAGAAERGIAACSAEQAGKPVRDCVAAVFDRFAGALAQSNSVAPSAAAARAVASGLRAVGDRAAAVSIVQRGLSVVRGLASESSGSVQSNYGLVVRAFARALSVIAAKG